METKDEGVDSDSSCELSDLPSITDVTEPPTGKKKFDKGEIVWAEYQNLYWPAMVQQVYMKERKARLWYLDSPKAHYKVPFTRMKSFRDGKISLQIREEAKQSPYRDKHEKLLSKTMSFLQRKSSGLNDNPVLFFEDGGAYIAAANLGLDLSTISTSNEVMSAHLDTSDKDADNKDNTDSDVCDEDEDYISENIIGDVSNETDRNIYTSKLVKFIISGDANQHLFSIFKNILPSERQKLYYTLRRNNDEKKLFFINSTGILRNSAQHHEIIDYLIDIFKKNITTSKFDASDIHRYVISVWVPEALMKAISVLEGIVLEEAQKLLFETDSDVLNKLFMKNLTIASESKSNELGSSSKRNHVKLEEKTSGSKVIGKKSIAKEYIPSQSAIANKKSPRRPKKICSSNKVDVAIKAGVMSIKKKSLIQITKTSPPKKNSILKNRANPAFKNGVKSQNIGVHPQKRVLSRGRPVKPRKSKQSQKVKCNLKQNANFIYESSEFEDEQNCDADVTNHKKNEKLESSYKLNNSNPCVKDKDKNSVTDACLEQINIKNKRTSVPYKPLIMRISRVKNKFGKSDAVYKIVKELENLKPKSKSKKKRNTLDVEVSNRILRTRSR